jgi:hypothetical protein
MLVGLAGCVDLVEVIHALLPIAHRVHLDIKHAALPSY